VTDAVKWIVGLVVSSGLATLIVAYLLLKPETAPIVGGWIGRIIALVWRKADKTAVALAVQGEINAGRKRLIENSPGDLFEHEVKIKWADSDTAKAVIHDNRVVVVMRDSGHKEVNVARALVTYLPKAVVPRARRYVDRETMQAADLVLAKSILADRKMLRGAIDAFFEEHMDPARAASESLCEKLNQLDRIDLHGWMTRIMLEEFRLLGNDLYPGEADPIFAADAEQFVQWLYDIAASGRDQTVSLDYRGPYFKVSVMFVAQFGKLALHGIEPYRRRAKRLIYQHRVDALYLLARDRSIEAVRQLTHSLEGDAMIASATEYVYPLRPDFGARVVQRDRAIATCLRRRRADIETPATVAEDEDENGLTHETVVFVSPTGEVESSADDVPSDATSESSAPST
jgi:hypothetical protein